MFGKFFACAFEGSMHGAGADVFAVWSYVISHTVNSRVEVNPKAVAPKIGMTIEEVEKALRYLQSKDQGSHHKEFDGRRMIKEGQYSYFIPTHRIYLMIKNSEDLRKYNAQKQRESRARKKGKPLAGEMAFDRAVKAGASQEQLDRIMDSYKKETPLYDSGTGEGYG